jgi:hypothetical protein
MGFSWSDLDPSKAFKSFFKDPFDFIGDIASDLYHGVEKVAKATFRETFRLLGITGENVLQGDLSSQLLSKDDTSARNIFIAELIKKVDGKTSTNQFIMNLLISGKFIFNKAYNYGKNTFSKGLPTYYLIDNIDTKEEDNAEVIAEALTNIPTENIVIDEAGIRIITRDEYMYSCLLVYYNYSPISNALDYNGKKLSVTNYITITSALTFEYGLIDRVIVKGAEYALINYRVHRYVSTIINPSAIPDKDEVTVTKKLTYNYFEEGTLVESYEVIEDKEFSLVDSGTGTIIEYTELDVDTGTFTYPEIIEKFQPVEEGSITVSISDTYAYEKDGITTYYSKVTTGVSKNYRIDNIRADRTVLTDTKWFSYTSSSYYLQGNEPSLGTTSYNNSGNIIEVTIKDLVDIKRNFPDFGDYTYIAMHNIFTRIILPEDGVVTEGTPLIVEEGTPFSVIRFHQDSYIGSVFIFCYNSKFDDINKYSFIPTLTSLLSAYYDYETKYTFPVIPLKRDSIWLDSYTTEFKDEVLALMKTINITSDELLEELKANTDGDNVTDIFVHFAIHPSEVNKNETVGKYLWYLLESIEDRIVPLPVGAKRCLGFAVKDERYNCSVVWEPTPVTTSTTKPNFIYNVYVDSAVNKGLIVQYWDGTYLYSKIMKNCSFTSYITRDSETVISEKSISDKGFHIPLIQEYIELLTPYEQIEILSCSLSLSCYASEWVHLEYYETEAFMGFVTFVSLAIMVVSLGSSIKVSGTMIALAKTATQIAISYGLKRAVEYIYEQTDNDVVRVLATATAIAVTVYASHELFDIDIVSLTSLNSATDIIQASMEIDLQYKAEQLEKEQIKFNENYEKKMDTLEEMYESLETNLDPFSIMQIKYSDTDWTPRLLSIDSYYNIALGGVDMDYNNRFTIGSSSYYEDKLKIGSI